MTKKFSWEHFHPYSLWTEDTGRPTFYNGKKRFIVDSRTQDKYLNEDLWVIRFKCFLLTFGTPMVHTIAAIVKIVFNVLKLISLYDFLKSIDDSHKENTSTYHFSTRLFDAGTNLQQIVFAPIAVILLEVAALYGMIMPRDGRKLYANLERLTYGHFVLAPCFQPEPEKHLFSGDLNQQNAF